MNITLVRHTKPDIDSGVCYGQTDVGLSDDFEEKAEQISRRLKKHGAFRLYSSPLSRCLRLARKISEQPVETDHRLMEASFGRWEGTAWDALDPDVLTKWAEDLLKFRPPGGESLGDLFQRSGKCLDDIIEKNKTDVVVVSHSGVIRCVLAYILDLHPEKMFRFHVDFGSLTHLSYENGRFIIKGVNITA